MQYPTKAQFCTFFPSLKNSLIFEYCLFHTLLENVLELLILSSLSKVFFNSFQPLPACVIDLASSSLILSSTVTGLLYNHCVNLLFQWIITDLKFLLAFKKFCFFKKYLVSCVMSAIFYMLSRISHFKYKDRLKKETVSCLVMSDSLQPCGLLPTRLLCPWDSPGRNTGVGCHSLLQRIFPT